MHSHYFVAAEESPAENVVADNSSTDDISMVELDQGLDQEFDDEEQISCTLPPISEIDRKCLRAKWILKTCETDTLTQSCTENLLSDVTDMCTNIIDELKADVLLKLQSASTPSLVID